MITGIFSAILFVSTNCERLLTEFLDRSVVLNTRTKHAATERSGSSINDRLQTIAMAHVADSSIIDSSSTQLHRFTSINKDPKFLAQLAEARRLRDDLPPLDTKLIDSFVTAGFSTEKSLAQWRKPASQLAASLREVLRLNCSLDRLHSECGSFSPHLDTHDSVMSAKRKLLEPLADIDRAQSFQEAYDNFICKFVGPHVADALPGTDTIYYATTPTLRVQTPSIERATIRPHCDGMYSLQAGSINFWLPLTAVSESSGLWIESAPGLENFHPVLLPTRFDGRTNIHFTIPNHSRKTRVSLDFRVVPGQFFKDDTRLNDLGYWSVASKLDATKPFVKQRSGRVSQLHGLPHASKATKT